ncbi:MAG TPA: TIM barrel protein [Isosphaeraceae bacterium]|jgi:sugar phosphate isomerase/epimerase|nr:TIM barrel protein [Isosphaeraceae bacterium]
MFASFNARAVGLSLSAAETIDLAAAAGFEGVDLLVRDLVDAGDDPAELRRRMVDLGLRGGAWPLPVDWRGDRGRFEADLERLPGLAEAAATLGLASTGTWLFPELPTRSTDARGEAALFDEVFALHVDRLGAIAAVLADHGTRLGLEVIGVETARSGVGRPIFAIDGPEFADLLAALRARTSAVGVLVDAFHLFAAGLPLELPMGLSVGDVVWVHVADVPAGFEGNRRALRDRDRDRDLPGECGRIDVRELLQTLAARGYRGPVTAEPLRACRSLAGLGPEGAARAVRSALGRVWPVGTPVTARDRGSLSE